MKPDNMKKHYTQPCIRAVTVSYSSSFAQSNPYADSRKFDAAGDGGDGNGGTPWSDNDGNGNPSSHWAAD